MVIIQLLSIAPTELSTLQTSCPPKAYLLFVSQVKFKKVMMKVSKKSYIKISNSFLGLLMVDITLKMF